MKKNNLPNPYRFFAENNPESNFATLEKASFFLEQEKVELDQMLLAFINSKDEITDLLNKRVNLDAINPSGVIKYLQNILKETRLNSFNTTHSLDAGLSKKIFFFILCFRKK